MKYAQMIMGLLIGTALGSSVIAATGTTGKAGAVDREEVKKIVRETISQEPRLIMDSVQKYQQSLHEEQTQSMSEALKDPELHAAVHNPNDSGVYGTKDSKRTVVEFFDYNCPACKAQYRMFTELLAQDKNVRIIFREYPIFGAQSETNAKIGLAITRLAPEKYYGFHEKMMSMQGRASEKDALGFAQELGLDPEKVKTEAAKPEVNAILESNRAMAEKLHIQGTPSLVIGTELIPHALGSDEMAQKLEAIK